MFEMLGNWSFGDYFKKEAIDWAWEFLTVWMEIPINRLYATIFEGSSDENIEKDEEAQKTWLQYLPKERILTGSKKDNFWEMGDTGPCGPCSEIHVDIRDDEERKKIDGATLVNKGHPHVIEIWNLVFIQFNRKSNGQLEPLPAKHVDTGMGFERLSMVVQGKQSNYDTDVFQPIIMRIGDIAHKKYGDSKETDIAMRVIADHVRTISFAIADSQLPSNTKAGYVIRRILRRAIRYGFTFLKLGEPFMYKLIPTLIQVMGEAYPELIAQKELIEKVILEEEHSFLRTLETGMKLLDQIIFKTKHENQEIVSGKVAFELYDTFGFPIDLTQLILREHQLSVDMKEFDSEMAAQKLRSKHAATTETADWNVLREDDEVEFIGYDFTEANIQILRYRNVKSKGKDFYQLVFNVTPFYAESGGQVGDSGYLEAGNEKIEIIDTQKENNLIVHIAEKLPTDPKSIFKAVVHTARRMEIMCNHSATHLLHYALRKILGTHVEQRGSLVEAERLRFDFSHFEKVSDEQLSEVEKMVNLMIRQNNQLVERREIPMNQAKEMGAMSLFGEKYGDLVRLVKFGDSIELCGGTHVDACGRIGIFKILSEGAIAAGIRRIEAITSVKAEEFVKQELETLKKIKHLLKSPKDVYKSVDNLIVENSNLQKQVEMFAKEKIVDLKAELLQKVKDVNGVKIIAEKIRIDSAASVKDLAFQLKGQLDNLYLVLGAEIEGKALLTVMISDNLMKDKNLNASQIIREVSKAIDGGGGGQPFYASAGGKNPAGLDKAIELSMKYIQG
jgi:alanyl-tRNA synthetase